jgi:hypothetical protein
MVSVDGVYIGPVALDDVPALLEQIRSGSPPLPDKQLRRRKSTDPGAARAVAGTMHPTGTTDTYGHEIPGDAAGPPAAIEHPTVDEADDA